MGLPSDSLMMSFVVNTVKAVVLTLLSVLRAILCCCRRNKSRGGISELDRSAVSAFSNLQFAF